MNFLLGFIFSLLIGYLAYYKKALSLSGFIGALIFGTLLFGFGTYIPFTILMVFFITSSLVTKKDEKEKEGRNFLQVFTNIIIALVFSFIYYMKNDQIYLLISVLSISVSTGDTWASEIGKRSKGKTVSVITFKEIPKGESGGITLLGVIASFLGPLLIALVFLLLTYNSNLYTINIYYSSLLIVLGGFLGSYVDSLLGILIQEKYLDLKTNEILEKVKNRNLFKRFSGIKYINNEFVNLITTLIICMAFTFILI